MRKRFMQYIGTFLAAALVAGSMPAAVIADEMPAGEEMIIRSDEASPESSETAASDREAVPEEAILPDEAAEEAEPENVITEEMQTEEEAAPAAEPVLLAAENQIVRPDGTSVVKLTVGTKKLLVKWKALPGQVEGYQLQYSTSGDFSTGAGKVRVDGDTNNTYTLTGLTSGKRYYIRVRGFRTENGKRVYAKWSNVKSARLAFNQIKISGTSQTRNIYIMNPKSSIKSASVAVWTVENGQDDLRWYTMKKTSAGSWKAAADIAVLLHEGTAVAHVYANDTAVFVGEGTFASPPMGFPICSSEEEYIERIAPAVQAACAKYGYLPSVLIAQSCLENGYGIPSYWDNPEIAALLRFNNMVGLKSQLLNSSWYDKTVWPGKSIVKKTPEEYGGVAVIITDSFRVYDSIEQSFEDYLLFMKYASNYGYGGTPKYGESILKIKKPKTLITRVSKLGYATGSTYPTSVMRIINKHNLTKYDK